jgi:hypothetical protein
MQFINAAERMPADIHRTYWCRVRMKPLEPRHKHEVPHMVGMGHVLSDVEIASINQEVDCMSLSVFPDGKGGHYFGKESINVAYLAQSIEWLEGDGATPTDQLVNPPFSYKMEKLKEMEDRAKAQGRTLRPI